MSGYATSKNNTLPTSIEVGSRKYDVLGYLLVQSGKTWKEDKTKIVLRIDSEEIATNWPMRVYKSLTHYREIYGTNI